MTRRIRAGTLLVLCAAGLALAACGEDDFENEPRPPVPVQLTGVITDAEGHGLAQRRSAPGPVVITVSNQDEAAHTVTLESADGGGPSASRSARSTRSTRRRCSARSPRAATRSRAGSEAAVEREIKPATLTIGKDRKSGSDELLLP